MEGEKVVCYGVIALRLAADLLTCYPLPAIRNI